MEPQTIQLLNSKVVIKSKDKSTHLELIIGDGLLEIIPVVEVSSSSTNNNKNLKSEKTIKKPTNKCICGGSSSCSNNPSDHHAANPSLNSPPMESNLHPLETELIIDNIGCYLSQADLQVARLINQKWSRTLKHHQTVQICSRNIEEFLQHQSTIAAISPSSSPPPPEGPSSSSSSQFNKYHIHNISFEMEEISTLFKSYGKYMTRLKIQLVPSTELNLNQFKNNVLAHCTSKLEEFELNDIIFTNETELSNRFWNQGPIYHHLKEEELSQHQQPPHLLLPKLKRIIFNLSGLSMDMESQVNKEEFKSFMIDFLNWSQNLEFVSFNAGYGGPGLIVYNPTPGIIISALSHKITLGRIKGLAFNYLSYHELSELLELSARKLNKLQLNTLQFGASNRGLDGYIITGGDGEGFSGVLKQLLQLQSPSLKSLAINIFEGSSSAGPSLPIPCCVALERLKLELWGKGMKCSFDEGSILTNFPCLKVLDYFTYNNHHNSSQELIEWEKHMTLTNPVESVSQLHLYKLTNYNKLYRLAELFPNLTKLNLDFDQESIKLLQSVWTKWWKLQALTIGVYGILDDEETSLLDECITGIRQEHHSTCLSICKSSLNYSPTDDLVLKKFKLMPGITDLKHLTKLHLKSSITISDVSAYFGFIHPKSSPLTHLVIENTINISLNCQAAIHESLGWQAYVELG